MLTFRQLINKTFFNFTINADSVRILEAKKIIDKNDGNPVVLAIMYSLRDSQGKPIKKPRKHRCYIKGLEGPKKKISASNIYISCDCEAFLFWCEYALNKKKAADIYFSNGKPAIVRNPKNIPTACVEEGALISTEKGLIPIEKLKIGDKVYTRKGLNTVTDHALTGENVHSLKFVTKSGRNVTVTPNHTMIVIRGCSLLEVRADNVEIGDQVIVGLNHTSKGYPIVKLDDDVILEKIDSIIQTKSKKVYDISVEDEHEFFANGILVHNCKHIFHLATVMAARNM